MLLPPFAQEMRNELFPNCYMSRIGLPSFWRMIKEALSLGLPRDWSVLDPAGGVRQGNVLRGSWGSDVS